MRRLLAALVAGCSMFFAAANYAQTPTPTPTASPPPLPSDGSPTASILFPDGRVLPILSQGGQFPLVLSSAGQGLTVQARIPAALASRLVLQSLDGGTISATSPVTADGTTLLQFQTGTQPGLYRLLVILGNYSATLQFWVPIPNGDNPPTLTP